MKELIDRGGTGNYSDFEFTPGARKTAQEIAKRAIVLCCVAASGQFKSGRFNTWLKEEGLWDELSPLELELLSSKAPSERQRVKASWRSEALQAMLWAIGKLDALPSFTQLVDVPSMLDVMPDPDASTVEFIESAMLRSDEEVDEESERTVEAHWQLRNEKFHPEEKAPEMISGVVVERHWALAWMINIDDEPWDQTPLTT